MLYPRHLYRQRRRKHKSNLDLPVYGISISERRRQQCEERIKVSKWFGVNGRTLPKHPHLKRGQVGCFMSHKQIWEYMCIENIQTALIIEDDVKFYPGWKSRTERALERLQNEPWDMLYLGRNHRLRPNKAFLCRGIARPGPSWGMFAYVLHLRGAQKLLAAPQVQNIQAPCDVLLPQLQDFEQYALHPCSCTFLSLGSDTRGIL